MAHHHTHSNAPGVSFSWSRALGISAIKGRISRTIGVPLTRSGRERKMGHIAMHLIGWLVLALVIAVGALVLRSPELTKALVSLIQGR